MLSPKRLLGRLSRVGRLWYSPGVRIAEMFYSIQGEGRLVGTPSLFIRTSGCNLRCVWCDTPYTSWRPEGRERSLREILRAARQCPARHVVVTGGEPLLAPDIEDLTGELRENGRHVTIETAGTIFKNVACDLMSLSPKLSHSTPWKEADGKFAEMHEARRLNLPVLRKFLDGYDCQLKFVVERRRDFAEIGALLRQLGEVDGRRVVIMPQGKTSPELRRKGKWIVGLCKKQGYGYSPRLQIELFGNRRGT